MRTLFVRDEWTLLWPFYTVQFLFMSTMFVGPFLVVYYQQRGLTLTQISILWAVMALVRILCETPTGAIADTYGRKTSSIIGHLLANFLWIFIPFTTSYISLLLLLVGIAFAQTLLSGAAEAWVYDWLAHNKKKHLVEQYYTKNLFFNRTGIIIGPFIGGLLATQLSLDKFFIIEGILGVLLSLLLLTLAKEAPFHQHAKHTSPLTALKKSAKHLTLNRPLTILFMASMSIAASTALYELAQQPYLLSSGLTIPQLGFFFSTVGIVGIFATFIGQILTRKIGEKKVLILTTLLMIFSTILTIFTKTPLFSTGLLLASIIAGTAQAPVRQTVIQHLIPTPLRATLLSSKSMFDNISELSALLIGGILLDYFGTHAGISITGIFLIPALFFYIIVRKHRFKNHTQQSAS